MQLNIEFMKLVLTQVYCICRSVYVHLLLPYQNVVTAVVFFSPFLMKKLY